MIILVMFAVICMASAAPEAAIYAVDGVEGLVYEIPEYEDPKLTEFKLLTMGAVPVLTIIETPASNQEDLGYYKDLSKVKKGLDDVITRLHQARTKMNMGNLHVSIELMRAIQELKNLERGLRTDLFTDGTSVKQSVSSDGFKTTSEISVTSQASIDSTRDDLKDSYEVIKTPLGESVYTSESTKFEAGGKSAFRKKWTMKTN